jgi:hypothetical protein
MKFDLSSMGKQRLRVFENKVLRKILYLRGSNGENCTMRNATKYYSGNLKKPIGRTDIDDKKISNYILQKYMQVCNWSPMAGIYENNSWLVFPLDIVQYTYLTTKIS